jgi:hypothetical protein
MGGERNWLVLSLKWSRGGSEWLMWYRTNDSGYTADLMQAGRYTLEEAKSREEEDVTLAVPLALALKSAENLFVVEAGYVAVEGFRGRVDSQKTA